MGVREKKIVSGDYGEVQSLENEGKKKTVSAALAWAL